MQKFKILLIFILVFALGSVVAGCKKTTSNKLYVGTNAEFPPFEYLENNVITGFDVDIIKEISKRTGKDIEFKNIAFDGLLPALQSNKIDIIVAGMTANDERKKSVSFSDPYFTSKQAILINKGYDKIKTFADLPGHNVGVTIGYTADLIVSKTPSIKVQRYNGNAESIMALEAGKIEAVVLDYETAKNFALRNKQIALLNTDLAKEDYAIAVRKDDTKLLQDINKGLQEIKKDGTYDRLLKKYFDIKK